MPYEASELPEIILPTYTPSRKSLKIYGQPKKSGEPEEQYQQRLTEEKKIKKEAERRFQITVDFVWTNEAKTGPTKFGKILTDWHEETDPVTMDLLQQMTALRIAVNKQIDQYRLEKRKPDRRQEDLVKRAVEVKYKRAANDIYGSICHQTKSTYGPPEEADDEEVEYPSKIFNLNFEDYLELTDKVASACSSNSYLEDLFLIFAPESTTFDVLYPEKLINFAQKLAPQEIDPQLKKTEQQIREHVQGIYNLDPKDLPQILYISKEHSKKWLERIVALPDDPKRYSGGGFIREIKYDEITIPINLVFVIVDPNMALVDQARIIFEEIYHASGRKFAEGSSKFSWPGWSDDGTDTLLEEGLTKEEGNLFFDTFFYQESREPGTMIDNILHYLAREGNEKSRLAQTSDILPGLLFRQIKDKCGGENFLKICRRARTNNSEALSSVKESLETTYGQGTFEYLAKIPSHYREAVIKAIRKLYQPS